jgi:hypothetical protein
METSKNKQILEATNGGLEIFKKYVNTEFEVDVESVVDAHRKFTVRWNVHYQNYVLHIDECIEGNWCKNTKRYNGIYFVQDRFGLNNNEALRKIDSELNLGFFSTPELTILNEGLGANLDNKMAKNEFLRISLGIKSNNVNQN